MTGLRKKLTDRGYQCSDRFASKVETALANRPVAGAFLHGPAGTGKSALPEHIAPVIGAEQIFAQCFPGTREDDLLVKMIPADDAKAGIKLVDGPIIEAVDAVQDGKKTVLTLDEWDKTRPSADSFLLDFLQSGRIRFNGHSRQLSPEQMNNLVVFITMNDERELSEPLLRRLPKIDFAPLPADLVRSALISSHGQECELIEPAVTLYKRCVAAELPKPATIQELRQLLDAARHLGNRADWDELVYQFVTKTPENHELLKRAEAINVREQERREERERLDVQAYQPEPEPEPEADEETAPAMPSLAEVRMFNPVEPAGEEITEDELMTAGGVVELSEDSYNTLARQTEPGETPWRLGDFAEVRGDKLVMSKPLDLREWDQDFFNSLSGKTGEVTAIDPDFRYQDMKFLIKEKKEIKVVKYSREEILAKATGIEMRWLKKTGLEMIINLQKQQADIIKMITGSAMSMEQEQYQEGRRGWDWKIGIIFARQVEDEQAKAIAAKEKPQQKNARQDIPDRPFKKWGRNELKLHGLEEKAVIEIEKSGQEDPAKGDRIEVTGTLYLPKDLEFGGRLQIMGAALRMWGNKKRFCLEETHRQKNDTWRGESYSRTGWGAYLDLKAEVQKINNALKERERKLKEAEKC